MSDFERIGGEEALGRIIEDFVGRTFEDVMIGFMFVGKNRARITRFETELAGEQLGGPMRYTGRPMGDIHGALPIMGGHFARRRTILENTLRDHGVEADIAARWLAHVDGLREQVLGVGVDGEHCDHAAQAARKGAPTPETEDEP